MSKFWRAKRETTQTSSKTSLLAKPEDLIVDYQLNVSEEFLLKALIRPRTDADLIEAFRNMKFAPKLSDSAIRTYRATLVKKGLIEATGERLPATNGRKAQVWQRTK